MSYKLKYKGPKIDELLDEVNDTFGNGSKTITIPAEWVDNEITVYDTWIEDGYDYIVSFTKDSRSAFNAAGIYTDDAVTAGELTFYCDSTPTDEIDVIVLKVAVNE